MLFLSAPTALGNRPYESDGTARLTTLGPARLREQKLVERLKARDIGDVPAGAYRDFVRPKGGVRNENLVLEHTKAIADKVAKSTDFTFIAGGDCSTLLGALLGVKRDREISLVYFDAHSDFGTEETSETGAVAGMVLAQLTGHGRSPLAHLAGNGPLVKEEHVVAVGVRETGEDFERSRVRVASDADAILDALGDRDFFIHVDADVLDPSYMPFVDSPTPGGIAPDALTEMLRPLVRHPRALGMELTIYDPRDDRDSRGAALLADIVDRAFNA